MSDADAAEQSDTAGDGLKDAADDERFGEFGDLSPMNVILPADTLETTIEIIHAMSHESVLRFGNNGIDARVVDPGNVAMTDVDLSAEAFESLGEGSYPAGIDHTAWLDTLNKVESGALVSLEFDPETRKVAFQAGRVKRQFALIDPDSIRNEPDLPDLDLPNSIEIPATLFKNAVEVCELVSDHLYIEADMDAETVRFRAEGDIDDAEYVFEDDDYEHADVREAATSIVSIDYLEDMAGVMPKDAVVELRFGDEFPIFCTWSYADGAGDVTQMLAPRIVNT